MNVAKLWEKYCLRINLKCEHSTAWNAGIDDKESTNEHELHGLAFQGFLQEVSDLEPNEVEEDENIKKTWIVHEFPMQVVRVLASLLPSACQDIQAFSRLGLGLKRECDVEEVNDGEVCSLATAKVAEVVAAARMNKMQNVSMFMRCLVMAMRSKRNQAFCMRWNEGYVLLLMQILSHLQVFFDEAFVQVESTFASCSTNPSPINSDEDSKTHLPSKEGRQLLLLGPYALQSLDLIKCVLRNTLFIFQEMLLGKRLTKDISLASKWADVYRRESNASDLSVEKRDETSDGCKGMCYWRKALLVMVNSSDSCQLDECLLPKASLSSSVCMNHDSPQTFNVLNVYTVHGTDAALDTIGKILFDLLSSCRRCQIVMQRLNRSVSPLWKHNDLKQSIQDIVQVKASIIHVYGNRVLQPFFNHPNELVLGLYDLMPTLTTETLITTTTTNHSEASLLSKHILLDEIQLICQIIHLLQLVCQSHVDYINEVVHRMRSVFQSIQWIHQRIQDMDNVDSSTAFDSTIKHRIRIDYPCPKDPTTHTNKRSQSKKKDPTKQVYASTVFKELNCVVEQPRGKNHSCTASSSLPAWHGSVFTFSMAQFANVCYHEVFTSLQDLTRSVYKMESENSKIGSEGLTPTTKKQGVHRLIEQNVRMVLDCVNLSSISTTTSKEVLHQPTQRSSSADQLTLHAFNFLADMLSCCSTLPQPILEILHKVEFWSCYLNSFSELGMATLHYQHRDAQDEWTDTEDSFNSFQGEDDYDEDAPFISTHPLFIAFPIAFEKHEQLVYPRVNFDPLRTTSCLTLCCQTVRFMEAAWILTSASLDSTLKEHFVGTFFASILRWLRKLRHDPPKSRTVRQATFVWFLQGFRYLLYESSLLRSCSNMMEWCFVYSEVLIETLSLLRCFTIERSDHHDASLSLLAQLSMDVGFAFILECVYTAQEARTGYLSLFLLVSQLRYGEAFQSDTSWATLRSGSTTFLVVDHQEEDVNQLLGYTCPLAVLFFFLESGCYTEWTLWLLAVLMDAAFDIMLTKNPRSTTGFSMQPWKFCLSIRTNLNNQATTTTTAHIDQSVQQVVQYVARELFEKYLEKMSEWSSGTVEPRVSCRPSSFSNRNSKTESLATLRTCELIEPMLRMLLALLQYRDSSTFTTKQDFQRIQDFLIDLQSFLHIYSLFVSPAKKSAYIQGGMTDTSLGECPPKSSLFCASVLNVIFLLMKDSSENKLRFWQLVCPPNQSNQLTMMYEPMYYGILHATNDCPDERSLAVLFDMLVDVPKSDRLKSECFLIQNPYILPLILRVVEHCQANEQSYVFDRILRLLEYPKSELEGCYYLINRSIFSRIEPSLLTWLLRSLHQRRFPPSCLDSIYRIVECVGEKHMSIRQLKYLFHLIQNEMDVIRVLTRMLSHGTAAAAAPTTAISKSNELSSSSSSSSSSSLPLSSLLLHDEKDIHCLRVPRKYFFFDQDSSGLQIPALPTWISNKGYSFVTWLCAYSKKSKPLCSSKTTKRYLYAFIDPTRKKRISCCLDGELQLILIVDDVMLPTGSRLTSSTWYFLSICHRKRRPFDLGKEDKICVYLNHELMFTAALPYPTTERSFILNSMGTQISTQDVEQDASEEPSGIQLLMGTIYFFSRALRQDMITKIDAIGSNYVLSNESPSYSTITSLNQTNHGFEESVLPSLFMCYHPSVWEGSFFFDNASLSDEKVIKLHARRLQGTYDISTQNIKDVMDSVGGIRVLFPLFTQLDMKSASHLSSVKGLDRLASIIRLMTVVLGGNVGNELYFQKVNGFAIVGYLLGRIAPTHLTIQTLEELQTSLHSFLDDSSRECRLASLLLKYVLSNFSLWVFSSVDVQKSLIQRLVQERFSPSWVSKKEVMEELISIQLFLDALLLYYWYDPPDQVFWVCSMGVVEVDKATPETYTRSDLNVPLSSYMIERVFKKELEFPSEKNAFLSRPVANELKAIRGLIFEAIQRIVDSKNEWLCPEDCLALYRFLMISCRECRQKLDFIQFMSDIFVSHERMNCLVYHLAGHRLSVADKSNTGPLHALAYMLEESMNVPTPSIFQVYVLKLMAQMISMTKHAELAWASSTKRGSDSFCLVKRYPEMFSGFPFSALDHVFNQEYSSNRPDDTFKFQVDPWSDVGLSSAETLVNFLLHVTQVCRKRTAFVTEEDIFQLWHALLFGRMSEVMISKMAEKKSYVSFDADEASLHDELKSIICPEVIPSILWLLESSLNPKLKQLGLAFIQGRTRLYTFCSALASLCKDWRLRLVRLYLQCTKEDEASLETKKYMDEMIVDIFSQMHYFYFSSSTAKPSIGKSIYQEDVSLWVSLHRTLLCLRNPSVKAKQQDLSGRMLGRILGMIKDHVCMKNWIDSVRQFNKRTAGQARGAHYLKSKMERELYEAWKGVLVDVWKFSLLVEWDLCSREALSAIDVAVGSALIEWLFESRMIEWINIPFEDVLSADCWLLRNCPKGGMPRVAIRILVQGMESLLKCNPHGSESGEESMLGMLEQLKDVLFLPDLVHKGNSPIVYYALKHLFRLFHEYHHRILAVEMQFKSVVKDVLVHFKMNLRLTVMENKHAVFLPQRQTVQTVPDGSISDLIASELHQSIDQRTLCTILSNVCEERSSQRDVWIHDIEHVSTGLLLKQRLIAVHTELQSRLCNRVFKQEDWKEALEQLAKKERDRLGAFFHRSNLHLESAAHTWRYLIRALTHERGVWGKKNSFDEQREMEKSLTLPKWRIDRTEDHLRRRMRLRRMEHGEHGENLENKRKNKDDSMTTSILLRMRPLGKAATTTAWEEENDLLITRAQVSLAHDLLQAKALAKLGEAQVEEWPSNLDDDRLGVVPSSGREAGRPGDVLDERTKLSGVSKSNTNSNTNSNRSSITSRNRSSSTSSSSSSKSFSSHSVNPWSKLVQLSLPPPPPPPPQQFDCELIVPMNPRKAQLFLSSEVFSLTFHEKNDGRFSMDSTEGQQFTYEEGEKNRKTWLLEDVRQVSFRRYQLRPCALEFFFADRTSILLNCYTKKDSVRIEKHLRSLKPKNLKPYIAKQPSVLFEKQIEFTTLWQQRKMSNFDYLMHLNNIAGRTCNDLAQYPIFPWILADYSSEELDLTNESSFRDLRRPMGVQQDSSREKFQQRYDHLAEEYAQNIHAMVLPPFHYGTHYSCPAYVMDYLIRLEPFTSYHLKLQNGSMDHSDRIFSSLENAYKSCISNPSDVRELIPELFYLPEMFINTNGIRFEPKQDGTSIDNVKLPPWAKSADDFIHKHRQALESEYVSQNLHHWIDLIFGYKQRPPMFSGGTEAVKACNVFFHLTYAGAVDLDKLLATDPTLFATTIQQIDCYGQTPPQLLTKPHACRRGASDVVHRLFSGVSDAAAWRRRGAELVGHAPLDGTGGRRGYAGTGNGTSVLCVHADARSERLWTIDGHRRLGVHRWKPLPPDVEPRPFQVQQQHQHHLLTGSSASTIRPPDGGGGGGGGVVVYVGAPFAVQEEGDGVDDDDDEVVDDDGNDDDDDDDDTNDEDDAGGGGSGGRDGGAACPPTTTTRSLLPTWSKMELARRRSGKGEAGAKPSASFVGDVGGMDDLGLDRRRGPPPPRRRRRRRRRSLATSWVFVVHPSAKVVFSCGHWDQSFKVTSLHESNVGHCLQSIEEHQDVVTCLAISQSGGVLVSGSRDTTVMVWKIASTQDMGDLTSRDLKVVTPVPLHVLYGHDDSVSRVDVNESFDLVLSASHDGTVMVHSLYRGEYIRMIAPHLDGGTPRDEITWCGISPSGKIVLYSQWNSRLLVYSFNGRKLSWFDSPQVLKAFCFSMDGESILVGGQGQRVDLLSLYDCTTITTLDGTSLHPRYSNLPKFDSAIESIHLCSDETYLMIGLASGTLRIFTLDSQYLRSRLADKLTNLGF